MANPRIHEARMAKRRLRKPGDLSTLRRVMWQSIIEAERVFMTTVDDDVTLRAVHAISQAAAGYARLLEVGEMEARLAVVESQLAAYAQRNGHARVPAQ